MNKTIRTIGIIFLALVFLVIVYSATSYYFYGASFSLISRILSGQVSFLSTFGILSYLFMIVLTFGAPIFFKFKYNHGRGLMLGSVIAFTYNWIDILVIKKMVVGHCTDWCGIENLFLMIPQGIIFAIGLIWFIILWTRSDSSEKSV